MIRDVLTVIWKEGRELLYQRGSARTTILGMLVAVGVMGVYMPWVMGKDWVTSPITLFYSVWLPMLFTASTIVDAFAGERERHTLEALLATRLPDKAILFGKMITSVLYAWGMMLLILVLGLLTVNVAVHGTGFLMYRADIGTSALVWSLLLSVLMAAAGVLVSLRAATVRQAYQTLSFGMLAFLVLPFVIGKLIPESWLKQLGPGGFRHDLIGAEVVIALIILAADILVVNAAVLRFQRARLILD